MNRGALKRRETAAAAKQKRQKRTAVVLLGVFAVLLVIQGPKLFDALNGSSDGSAVALPVTPVATAPPGDGEKPRGLLRSKGLGSDPFASRSLANNDPRAGAVPAPRGAKDPFVPRGSASVAVSPAAAAQTPELAPKPLPKRIVIGTPTPNAVAKRGWIVVLASIQTRAGRTYAERFAARVRINGLSPIAVLDSSTRKPLRSGYYVVYTGPFASLGEVQRSADHVHAFGYRTAYIREILRY